MIPALCIFVWLLGIFIGAIIVRRLELKEGKSDGSELNEGLFTLAFWPFFLGVCVVGGVVFLLGYPLYKLVDWIANRTLHWSFRR